MRWHTPTNCSTTFSAGPLLRKCSFIAAGAVEQLLDIEPQQRRRQQAHGRQHRKPPAHAVGHSKHLATTSALASSNSLPLVPVTGTTSSPSSAASPPSVPRSSRSRMRNAAAVSSVPPLLLITTMPHRRRGSPAAAPDRAAHRCRRCSPRNKSAAGRAASSARPRCNTGGSTPRAAPAPPCTNRRCPARRRSRRPRQPIGRRLDPPDLALAAMRPQLRQQPIRQLMKPRIQRLLLRRRLHRSAHNCASASTSSRAASNGPASFARSSGVIPCSGKNTPADRT